MFRKMLTAAALAFSSMTAQADTLTLGVAFGFNWSFDTGTGVIIEGTGEMTGTLVNTDDLQLVITLNNETDLVSGNMALVSFGFGIDPDATAVTVTNDGTLDWAATLNTGGDTKIPSLGDVIEICAFTGNSCSGGAQPDGLQAGDSDTFTLVLAGDYNDGTIDVEPIGFKFQGTVGSFEFFTTDREPPQENPAPGTLALFGLALLLGRFAMRRRTMLS